MPVPVRPSISHALKKRSSNNSEEILALAVQFLVLFLLICCLLFLFYTFDLNTKAKSGVLGDDVIVIAMIED